MQDPAFEWDLALLPESCLAYLNRQPQDFLGTRTPVPIGHVLNSVFELVGAGDLALGDVRRVYHFEGSSSMDALTKLLKCYKGSRPITIPLQRSKLLPLLQFWEEGSAILAKPPMTRIYGVLFPAAVKESWGVVWQTSEAIMLAGSKGFLEREGGKTVAETILSRVYGICQKFLADPQWVSRRARSEGLVRFCHKLLLAGDARREM